MWQSFQFISISLDSLWRTGDGDVNTGLGSVPPTRWRSSSETKEWGTKEGRSRYSRFKPKEFVAVRSRLPTIKRRRGNATVGCSSFSSSSINILKSSRQTIIPFWSTCLRELGRRRWKRWRWGRGWHGWLIPLAGYGDYCIKYKKPWNGGKIAISTWITDNFLGRCCIKYKQLVAMSVIDEKSVRPGKSKTIELLEVSTT